MTVEGRHPADQGLKQDQFGVTVVVHRCRNRCLFAIGQQVQRPVVVEGLDRFALLRAVVTDDLGGAVAKAEIDPLRLGLDIAAGTTDADGRG